LVCGGGWCECDGKRFVVLEEGITGRRSFQGFGGVGGGKRGAHQGGGVSRRVKKKKSKKWSRELKGLKVGEVGGDGLGILKSLLRKERLVEKEPESRSRKV